MARRRSDDDDDVPRLPRGKGLALSTAQIVRIVMVAAALVALIALQGPCAKSMSRFVTSFDDTDAAVVRRIDAAAAAPQGELLRADMTPAELEAAIARERDRAAAAGVAVDAGVAPGDAGAGATAPPR